MDKEDEKEKEESEKDEEENRKYEEESEKNEDDMLESLSNLPDLSKNMVFEFNKENIEIQSNSLHQKVYFNLNYHFL